MHDPPEEVATKHSAKRLTSLNDHEGHFLRRRLDAYKKAHDRELNDVVNHLEEIRETVKSLSTDPAYGTHAVSAPSNPKPRTERHLSAKNRRLRRTQSFPEATPVPEDSHRSFPLISGKDCRNGRMVGSPVQGLDPVAGKNELAQRRIAPTPASPTLAGSSATPPGHRKVERSKTAPISLLQPLLKTTPEMMKRKIVISNFPRQPNLAMSASPPRYEGTESGASGAGRLATGLRRKAAQSPGLQMSPNNQVESPSQSRKTVDSFYCEASGKSPAKRNSEVTRVDRGLPTAEERSALGEPRVSTAGKGRDFQESSRTITKDLKQCRYTEFVKDRPGDNFI